VFKRLGISRVVLSSIELVSYTILWCDMLPKAGIIAEPVETINARQQSIKHVPAATNIVGRVENARCFLHGHCYSAAR
jgi:hypothetical protein